MTREIWGNLVQNYVSAVLTFLAVLAAVYVLRRAALRRIEGMSGQQRLRFHDFFLGLLGKVHAPEYVLLAVFLASRCLILSGGLAKVLHIVFVMVITVRAALLLQESIRYGLSALFLDKEEAEPATAAALKNIRVLVNVVLWAIAAVFILENLGVNISAAVAGLGVGGIAVAMAAQQILGDLFSSFVIYMDKPFSIGDEIQAGDWNGTVEYVGIKTTRLRSDSGELLVLPNSSLTSSRIRNFKRMERRHVRFSFKVSRQTPLDKVRALPDATRQIVEAVPKTSFDRAHLKNLGGESLEFEVAYYVLGRDYGLYMDVQQKINLAILERLQKEGVALA